jgi:hypothetical protein
VGVSTVSGGTQTVLTGDPAAVNSLTHPTEVSPATHRVGASGPAFHHTFPANSVTVLTLSTS